jgi:F-type H+-transporting ATPase subunit delta
MVTAKQQQREARRLFRLCLVNGLVDEDRVRQIVRRGVAGGRSGSLGVMSRFLRLVKLERSRHAATVESAVPLPPDLRAQLTAMLGQRYGEGTAATFAEDPALIAGVRIRVGSDVYDGSVAGRLAELEARFQ